MLARNDERVSVGKTIRPERRFGQGFSPFATDDNAIVAIFAMALSRASVAPKSNRTTP